MMDFYQLSSKCPSPETPDEGWFTEAKQTLLCKGCSSPRVTGRPIDVVLETKPDKSALNFVHGVCIHVATTALLQGLFPDGPNESLLLGKVFGPDRKEAVGFETLMNRERILVRGNEHSTFRVCPDCQRVWYSAIGKRYILRRDIGNGTVYESQYGDLVVSEDAVNRVIGRTWRNLFIRRLEVRDEPVDGLEVPE